MPELPKLSTTAAQVSRNFGLWQDRAMAEAVLVTHHGRPRVVITSADSYTRLGEDAPQYESADRPAGVDSLVLDRMTQGLVVLDEAERIIRVNRAAAEHFRRPAEMLVGTRLSDLHPGAQSAIQSRIIQRVLRTGEAVTFESPSSLYPGQVFRIDAFAHGGGVAYLFQAVADEETRQSVADHEAMEALFAAHGAAGTAHITPRGTFASVDASLLELSGLREPDLHAIRLTDMVPPSSRPPVRDALEAVLNGSGPRGLDAEIVAREGHILPVRLALAETRSSFAIDGAVALITPRPSGAETGAAARR